MIPPIEDQLRCPACRGVLATLRDAHRCDACDVNYPNVRGVPILIDDKTSSFRVAELAALAASRWEPEPWTRRLRVAAERYLPLHGENLAATTNIRKLAKLLRSEGKTSRILIAGGARLGLGCEALANDPTFTLVECDVLFGPRTSLICDVHQIPFADGTFDAVVAQGVFEYLVDPFRAADEIHRVLRPRGFVYAESPFLQPVHGGAHDRFRFTPAGHRLLFKRFDELGSGITAGPATVFSNSYRYLLRAFMDRAGTRFFSDVVARVSSLGVFRLDRFLGTRPGALDASSGVFFLGRRRDTELSARELADSYRGSGQMGY